MEMVDFSKNPRYHIHENTPQYQEQMKIYEKATVINHVLQAYMILLLP